VTKARQFIAQIDAYDEILIGERCKIKSRWIHFPLAGVMVEIDSRDEDAK
jgi:hypothetical protein